eukprot:TRINITY_DN47896_c0_g1_i1.p1 TRINITY_DN47896_c0_g1~~TRINITY_DN47896_c0_g1_i1.p1  ORF type:complete len:250 (+),score=53.75 TRINITY_DN47896_c0_g1_i1:78-827(+)
MQVLLGDSCSSCFAAFTLAASSRSTEAELLPTIRRDCLLFKSLEASGYDVEDIEEVLCNPTVTKEILEKSIDDIPRYVRDELISRIKFLDQEEEPKDEVGVQACSVFAYGTLRGDFSPSGDKWGILGRFEGSWNRATVRGYRLYQDPRLTFPFAVHTGRQEDEVHGTTISFKSEDAPAAIAACNNIEGFNPSQPEAGLYRRTLENVSEHGPDPKILAAAGRPTKAFIYHQVWPKEHLPFVKAFPTGQWY